MRTVLTTNYVRLFYALSSRMRLVTNLPIWPHSRSNKMCIETESDRIDFIEIFPYFNIHAEWTIIK